MTSSDILLSFGDMTAPDGGVEGGPMSVVSVEAIRGFRDLVAELGGDAGTLLSRARIRTDVLDDPRNLVPIASVFRLLEDAARALRCPDFGLRLAARHDIGILGPLAIAVQNSVSLGDALACASRYLFTHSSAVAFSTRPAERDGRVLLAYEIRLKRPQATVQDTEMTVAFAARVGALLSEGRLHLRRVWFPHARCASIAAYRAHFGVPVVFERDVAALEVDAADLSLRISSARRELRELAVHYLESRFGAQQTPLAARVREVVLRSLGTGYSASVDVVSALGMHPRTLQRQLQADGTSFEKIKDEARAELAHRYLAQGGLPLSHIASLLDYSEQSAFTRSCYRWFERPPRVMRAELVGRRRAEEAGEPAARPPRLVGRETEQERGHRETGRRGGERDLQTKGERREVGTIV
ncbi:AraC family transcriptional regulator [Sorangium sp. So ce1014]|uniref:AraC family transcriptional regulator n=1 Tax=Sorangium sp. So ce1014 TaxID=3133326 RepID=UPI003F5E386A